MELDQFIADNGVRINENVKIKYTEEFGYGVYLNASNLVLNGKPIDGARYELMRIPQEASWNISLLVELVDELDSDLRDVINSFIRYLIFEVKHEFSEIFTLTIYLSYLVIFSKSSKTISDRIGEYLKILQNTKIDTPLSELVRKEDVARYYKLSPNENWETPEKDIEMLKLINESLPSKFDRMSLEEFIHLKIVIRSRVLEVPEEIEDPEDNDDFTVKTTLVPILDFVNHNNDLRNSWFDVDRDTNDILLIYENTDDHDDELQLFFSYSPVEDIRRFAFTYGFIPRNHSAKFIEISIDKTYLQKQYPLSYQFCRQFKVLSNLSFVVHFEEDEAIFDELNLSENQLYLSFAAGLKLIGTTDDGVKFEYLGEQVRDSWHLKQLLGEEETHKSMYGTYISFVNDYLNFKIRELDTELNRFQDKNRQQLISYQLVEVERKAIESFIEKFNSLPDGNKVDLISLKDDYNEYKVWSNV